MLHARSGGSVGCVGPLARSTFYPCRHTDRTPYAACAVERVAANPLHRSAPSLKTVSSMLTRLGYGRLDPGACCKRCCRLLWLLFVMFALSAKHYAFFSCAPSGTTPCST